MARIAQIVSTARFLPERVVTNAELTARFTALGKPTVVDRLAASTGPPTGSLHWSWSSAEVEQ
jgi:hypothetical protein